MSIRGVEYGAVRVSGRLGDFIDQLQAIYDDGIATETAEVCIRAGEYGNAPVVEVFDWWVETPQEEADRKWAEQAMSEAPK